VALTEAVTVAACAGDAMSMHVSAPMAYAGLEGSRRNSMVLGADI